MKAKISTYHDLKVERLRLESQLAIQSSLIKQDVSTLRQELKPVRSVLSFVGKLVSKDNKNPLLNMGVDVVGDLLFRNLLFSKAGFITKNLAPFILKNLSSNFLSKNGDGILHILSDKIKQVVSGFGRPKRVKAEG